MQFPNVHTIKYADDTSTYFPLNKTNTKAIHKSKTDVQFEPPEIGQNLITSCSEWSSQNGMRLNADKTQILNISLRKQLTIPSPMYIQNPNPVKTVSRARLHGVTIDEHLNFNEHINKITISAKRKCHGLLVFKQSGLSQESLLHLYKTRIILSIAHAAPSWYPLIGDTQKEQLEKCQRRAMNIILSDITEYHAQLAEATLPHPNDYLQHMCHKYMTNVTTNHTHRLFNRLPPTNSNTHSTRNKPNIFNLYFSRCRTNVGEKAIFMNTNYF
mgnify:FL=1